MGQHLSPRCTVLLMGLALLLIAPVATAQAAAQGPTEPTDEAPDIGDPRMLYAHWPEGAAPGAGGEVLMDAYYPHGEPDLSSGPLAPGASGPAGATPLPEFTYRHLLFGLFEGPGARLSLDASQPARLIVYLSADQTPTPNDPALPTLPDVDQGVAPIVTVEAELRSGGRVIATGAETRTLINLPGTSPVERFTVELPLQTTDIGQHDGLVVTWRIHQVDANGERAMQNLWNLHTGEDHPTGLWLPAIDPMPLRAVSFQVVAPGVEAGLFLDPSHRTGLQVLLLGSMAGTVLTGRRMWRRGLQLRSGADWVLDAHDD